MRPGDPDPHIYCLKLQTMSNMGDVTNVYSFNLMPCGANFLGFTGVNTLRPRQNGRHFTDAIFKCTFMYENIWASIKISLKFVPTGPVNNIPALVQIMACRRPGDKPLSEPMMVSLLTHICVARPQWVNTQFCPHSCLASSHAVWVTTCCWRNGSVLSDDRPLPVRMLTQIYVAIWHH